jgi:transcriptional regulator with XRE-family HTH domain
MPRALPGWKARVADRLRALRVRANLSQWDVDRETRGRITRSALGNYESGTRLPGIEEAQILGKLYDVPAFYILCLEEDTDVVLIDPIERQLMRDFRALPERDRMDYVRRIGALAVAYRDPVPDEKAAKHLPGRLNHDEST